ncbi:MAG: hypothetical protein AAGB24_10690 [Bacteroidota bacterium]
METKLESIKGLFGRKEIFYVMKVFVLALVLVGCSDDEEEELGFEFPLEGSNLSIADIAGNWTATFAQFSTVGVPDSSIEIIAAGGSATLNIQDSGRFTSTISLSGEGSQQFSGQMGFSGSFLALLDDTDEPGDEAFLDIDLTPEDELFLGGTLEFDFDEDGNFEPTITNLRLIR